MFWNYFAVQGNERRMSKPYKLNLLLFWCTHGFPNGNIIIFAAKMQCEIFSRRFGAGEWIVVGVNCCLPIHAITLSTTWCNDRIVSATYAGDALIAGDQSVKNQVSHDVIFMRIHSCVSRVLHSFFFHRIWCVESSEFTEWARMAWISFIPIYEINERMIGVSGHLCCRPMIIMTPLHLNTWFISIDSIEVQGDSKSFYNWCANARALKEKNNVELKMKQKNNA